MTVESFIGRPGSRTFEKAAFARDRQVGVARRFRRARRRAFESFLLRVKRSDAIEAELAAAVELAQGQFMVFLMKDITVVAALLTLAGLIQESHARRILELVQFQKLKMVGR